jgi:hypothetical protein
MGCVNTRQQTAFEESFLLEEQLTLGFEELDAVEVDMTVRKFSFNYFTNPSQLQHIEQELKVKLHDTGTCPQVTEMMTYLQHSHGWESKKLLILGLLCCSANPHIKAKLLFEAYDETFNGCLNSTQVRELLREMCFISSQALGALVPRDHKSSQVVERYIRRCTASVDRSVLNLLKHFKDPCSDGDFVVALATLHDGMLLSPSGIRGYLHVEYTRNGPGKDFSNMSQVRSRTGSLTHMAARVRSVGYIPQDRMRSYETSSTDEIESGSVGHVSSVDYDLSKLH